MSLTFPLLLGSHTADKCLELQYHPQPSLWALESTTWSPAACADLWLRGGWPWTDWVKKVLVSFVLFLEGMEFLQRHVLLDG